MKPITANTLIEQARTAASLYDECDQALAQLNETFGAPYEASRSSLTAHLTTAEQAGLDLEPLRECFKFPEVQTQIIVRIHRVPTGHKKLDKVDAQIEKLEAALKVAKIERKKLIEQLHTLGQIDMATDKITTAFSRIK